MLITSGVSGGLFLAILATIDPGDTATIFVSANSDPAAGSELKSTADGKRHVYYRISDSRWEIYDLASDPDEKSNIAGGAGAKELQRALVAWIEGPLGGNH